MNDFFINVPFPVQSSPFCDISDIVKERCDSAKREFIISWLDTHDCSFPITTRLMLNHTYVTKYETEMRDLDSNLNTCTLCTQTGWMSFWMATLHFSFILKVRFVIKCFLLFLFWFISLLMFFSPMSHSKIVCLNALKVFSCNKSIKMWHGNLCVYIVENQTKVSGGRVVGGVFNHGGQKG